VALVGAELKPTLQLVDTPGVRLAAVHDKEDTVGATGFTVNWGEVAELLL
jgi:hypothetical protein